MLVFCATILSCDNSCSKHQKHVLEGVWVLQQSEYPGGSTSDFTSENRYMLMYVGDSLLYRGQLTQTPSAIVVSTTGKSDITLINIGGNNWVYMEDDGEHPLYIENDSTIVIQRRGIRYRWRQLTGIYQDWGRDIQELAERELGNADAEPHSYVLSAKERQQASLIHMFTYASILFLIIIGIIVQIAVTNRRAKHRLQLQLQQIQEEHDQRPQPVRQALESVAASYFGSDEYRALLRQISSGQRLKEEDWNNMENQLKQVYPGFCNQLRTLYSMSELEYQVCLLIKLRIAPTDMATVLMRDASTISTVRSRLYKKVFGKKGGAKEWDEFILSIGA